MRKYFMQNSSYCLGALFFVLISTAFAVVLQFLKGDVLDYAVAGKIQTTLRYSLLLIVFILCEVILYFFYKRLSAKFIVGCTKCLKYDVFNSVLFKSYVEYKTRPQGEYIAKYTNEIDTIKARQFSMLPLLGEILLKIVFVSVALFWLDWRIAFVSIFLLTTPLYIPKLIEKRLQKAQTEHLKAVEDHLAKVNDWLSGFEIIKNYSIEKKILERFDSSNSLAMGNLLRDFQVGALAQLITTLISYLSYFIVLICSTWLVLKGDFSAGDFFIAIGMIDQLSYPLISLAEIIRQLVAIKPTCDAMEKFIGLSETAKTKKSLENFSNEISFHNVDFAYKEQTTVLRNFNLRIQKGKRYLLQGPSGCGKTTAVNLLLRYFDATNGYITIDGKPIESVYSTYDCMTVVRQEAVLFHDTLRNNLTMYQDISDEKMMSVLVPLGLDDFANSTALDLVIAENGANLSGGEKKRICLARALLRDSDILILDEPLANLDDDTARKIEDLLLSIQNKTMLVVSHQFSEEKIKMFDQVVNFASLEIDRK